MIRGLEVADGEAEMADFADMSASEAAMMGEDNPSGFLVTLTNWIGALLSIALLVGLGIWVYQLAVRDVSGVPVVRALEGPMRIQPENPGGEQAAHQGLAVNSVAAEGGATAPAEQVVLAPAPVDLTEEDLPRPELETVTATAEPEIATPSHDELLAMAAELTESATPLETLAPTAISAEIPAVRRSPIPLARPAGDFTAQAIANSVTFTSSASANSTNADNSENVLTASIPSGTRLVQFGAYDTPSAATEAWGKLTNRFGDFMAGKSRVVQEATSGGKTFYRLRAMGFSDINDARRFCSALLAERQACIPVVIR